MARDEKLVTLSRRLFEFRVGWVPEGTLFLARLGLGSIAWFHDALVTAVPDAARSLQAGSGVAARLP